MVTGPDIEPMKFKSRREAKDGVGGIIREYRSLRSVGMRRGGWWRGLWAGHGRLSERPYRPVLKRGGRRGKRATMYLRTGKS